MNAFFWGVSLLLVAGPCAAQTDQEVEREPKVVKVSPTRYRVGSITIDTAKHRFEVPGHVLRREPPLEYFAVSRGGAKGYESLLELDATAYEFNLSCILIGFDASKSKSSKFQFDTSVLEGQAVRIEVSWKANERTESAPASHLLSAGGKPVDDDAWVYIGSMLQGDGQFMAAQSGALIGFVHDPTSVIEHAHGLGIGNYGLLGGNEALVPEEGAPLTVSIELAARQ